MDYLALYRKYRPKKLNEVVGQSEIKKILANSVEKNTITHAYLFSGPRGTGKTTMAKILAKMVNCLEPVDGDACNKCKMCQNILDSNDIVEIDAASNNGVDEIRELREKANLVPSIGKYKVYIIDEVHMLTTQAFNALLKTLEEPPKHVIFILATTEYYKIPLTITSRCQKFQFTKINTEDIVDRLKEISKKEKIKITDDALLEIAKISDGGLRDSINFLDQLRSFNTDKITLDDVYEVCGNVSTSVINDLFNAIRDNNYGSITEFFEDMDINGKNYNRFFENIICYLKDSILINNNVDLNYIKSDLDVLKNINSRFEIDEIFYMIETFDSLVDKLKNVSRQSMFVITNFMIMMNKINNGSKVLDVKENVQLESEKYVEKYDMAFNFTSNDGQNENNFTDNIVANSDKNSSKIDENIEKQINDNRDIIINNTFALASKIVKNNLQVEFTKANDYLTDSKYKGVAGLFLDTKIEVAGKNYIIFSVKNDAIIDKIYSNYELFGEFISNIFSGKYNFVVLNQEEWNKYRDEYVENFKNGKKYILKELKVNSKPAEKEKKKVTIVDKLFDIVGEDNIEFK